MDNIIQMEGLHYANVFGERLFHDLANNCLGTLDYNTNKKNM